MTDLSSLPLENLAESYLHALETAGMYVGPPVISVTRTFFDRIGADGWAAMPLAEQCQLPAKYRRTVGWLIATTRVTVSPEYLVRVPAYLGGICKWVYPAEFAAFTSMTAGLGFWGKSLIMQWSAMAKAAGIHGVRPDALTADQLLEARDRLLGAMATSPGTCRAETALSRDFYQASTTAFHLGWIECPLARRAWNRRSERQAIWDSVPPRLACTLLDYIDQVRLSLRPSTVESIERALRELVIFLAEFDPDVACVADIRRRHIEGFKLHLARRPSAKGGSLNRHTIAQHLGALRTCFERLSEWDGDDVPCGVLVFAGDFPIRDQPLPRFIDDGAAARLLTAARAHPDLFTRLSVEFLARTGMRRGEFMALTVDSVVQIGSSFWLRVPLGKLHSDRYIPLHPQLKALLDEWIYQRPAGIRSDYLFIRNGRRIGEATWRRLSLTSAKPRGSPGSPPTNSATPWPPKPSTVGCPSKPSPPFSVTDPCG